jgi:uncharacterized protein YjiK
MMAAFSLDAYEAASPNVDLNMANPPGGTFTDYSGVAYSDVTDTIFVVDNEDTEIFEYDRGGNYLRTISLNGFTDTEGIYHMGGTQFAVVEEVGFGAAPQTFHVSTFSIAGGGPINKAGSMTTTLSHLLLNDDPGNNGGLEGVAHDPNGFFYVAKEEPNEKRIFRVPVGGMGTEQVTIATVTGAGMSLADLSDIFFIRNPTYPDGRLFLMSDDSERIIMADFDPNDPTGLTANVVLDATMAVIDLDLPQQAFEGLGFTPDSFEMYTVADDEVQSELRLLLQFRNFTVYTPPATNMSDLSDTGALNNDDITSVTTPSFTGRLERVLATGTVPVENAFVWLYVDGNPVNNVGVAAAANGDYSITPTTALAPGTRVIEIKASEDANSPEDQRSLSSLPLTVTIDSAAPTVTISNRTTNDTTPSLTGTIADNLFGPTTTIQVTVNGQNYNATNNGNGTWTLADNTITPALGPGTYSVLVTATDPAGNVGTDTTSNELVIDLTNPSVTAKTPENTMRITATVDIDVTFSEAVMGLDATDLTLTGSATGPHAITVDPPVNVGGNTWRFRVRKLRTGTVNVTPNTAGITDVAGNPLMAVNWSFSTVVGDLNGDGETTRKDGALLMANYGKTTGATAAQGDLDLDGRIGAEDLFHYQVNLTPGGEGLMGGGGGGGESMSGGEGGGGEEMSGGGGGGGESFSGTPARFYFTTSASTSGGGVLGSTIPAITLPSPGQFVDLYVWVQMGDYDRLGGYGLDVRATTGGVVKATASQVYNAEIWDVEFDEYVGDRWNGTALLSGTLNASGVGAAELATGPGSFAIGGGMELLDEHDGGSSGLVDMLYDAANDAFLLQRVRLESLPGSAGLSTGLALSIGRLGLLVDNTSIYTSLPIYLGLGTTSIENNVIGATDGSTHATITVAAGSPGAVVASAPFVRTSGRADVLDRAVLRAVRSTSNLEATVSTPDKRSNTPQSGGSAALRAVRRIAGTAVDRAFGLGI